MANNNDQTMSTDASKKPIGEQLRMALQIFTFVRPYRGYLILGLVLLFLSSLVFMIFPYLSGEMVDIALGKSKYPITLKDVGFVLLIILVVQGFVSYFRVLLFATVSEKGIADVRRALYQKLISLPIVFFEKSRTGELVSRLTADVEKLYSAFSITLAEFMRQVIILISGIVFLAITTPMLALIMLATFPLIVVGAMFFGRYIRRLSKERQGELANSNIILNETMQNIHVVKAFTNEIYEHLRYGKSIFKTVKVSLKYAKRRALFSVFIITVLFGALFFIVWEGAIMVSNGTITPGQLISFVVYTAIIGAAIAGLGNFYTELLGAIGATERVREIQNEQGEVKVDEELPPPAKRLQGHIEFGTVNFYYPTRTDVQILKNISFEVA
ncbi:MAG: ABC transporter transmembrane domain-containing protein, partial [Saprospiraceae bacterium]